MLKCHCAAWQWRRPISLPMHAALAPPFLIPPCSMSKAAANMAGQLLALELAPLGIPLVLIHPGAVTTDMYHECEWRSCMDGHAGWGLGAARVCRLGVNPLGLTPKLGWELPARLPTHGQPCLWVCAAGQALHGPAGLIGMRLSRRDAPYHFSASQAARHSQLATCCLHNDATMPAP